MKTKEVIVSRKLIPFYQTCYARCCYRLAEQKRVGRHLVLTFQLDTEKEPYPELLRATEEKLRIIELTNRKKCGFRSLFLNLLVHIALFCQQATILYRMKLTDAHPRNMLEAGIPILVAVLLLGLCIKLKEIFRWNRTQRELKQEILALPLIPEEHVRTEHSKIISVLFTRNRDPISELIYWVTGRQYTHASLGLGEQTEEFFSFDGRGFRREHPGHRKAWRGQKESLCYQFRVTEPEYELLQQNIESISAESISYNTLGAVLCVLHIYKPSIGKKVYFCSEFVSEQLRALPSFQLNKAANMYLPTNLAKVLAMQKNLYRVYVNQI